MHCIRERAIIEEGSNNFSNAVAVGTAFYNSLCMKNMELTGTARLLESVLQEYSKKSCLDDMEAYLRSIPEPKLGLLIEAMSPEEIARFEDWSRDAAHLEEFKAGPSREIDRLKDKLMNSPYELIRRFEELQDAVDREIMKYELWLAANPIARPLSSDSLASAN